MASNKSDKDEEEHDAAHNHPVYDVHELEEEVNEEKDEDEGGTHGKGGSEEFNKKDEKTQILNKEQIEDASEWEVVGIIKDLVDQEVEYNTKEVLKETEES